MARPLLYLSTGFTRLRQPFCNRSQQLLLQHHQLFALFRVLGLSVGPARRRVRAYDSKRLFEQLHAFEREPYHTDHYGTCFAEFECGGGWRGLGRADSTEIGLGRDRHSQMGLSSHRKYQRRVERESCTFQRDRFE